MISDTAMAVLLLVAGALLLLLGRRVERNARAAHAACTKRVAGTVVEVISENARIEEDAAAANYYPILEYEFGGTKYRTGKGYSLMNPVSVGDKYAVFIDPADPSHAVLERAGIPPAAFAARAFGLAMAATALLLVADSVFGLF